MTVQIVIKSSKNSRRCSCRKGSFKSCRESVNPNARLVLLVYQLETEALSGPSPHIVYSERSNSQGRMQLVVETPCSSGAYQHRTSANCIHTQTRQNHRRQNSSSSRFSIRLKMHRRHVTIWRCMNNGTPPAPWTVIIWLVSPLTWGE